GVTVATRGGPRELSFAGEQVTAEIGPAVVRPERPRVSADGLAGEYDSVALELPNPHVVVELASLDDLAALRLAEPPRVTPALPEGQNVEFVVRTGPRRLRMRVHERGSGETRSCGSGICAAVAALAGPDAGGEPWLVEVPGGRCRVAWNADGAMMLSGPAVLVASLELSPQWLASHR
ncbi:MAG: diaminopimelate epimerase, partial [Actinobacteria bacterium]|nr:diaminopimelate epimerase [Actinomycetota bacterium]